MPNPVFEAIVSTQDRSSPVLQAITRRIETLEHAAEKTQLATERMALRPIGALAGLRGSLGHVAGAFGHVRGVIGEVMRGITELMPRLAALGGAGSLAGMFDSSTTSRKPARECYTWPRRSAWRQVHWPS